MTAVLAAHDLHKSFGATPALAGAGLEVDGGEIVAVMGPSGSGKSTLLHCLAGIVRPDSGTVTFEGRELSELADAERSALRRSRFGFVFQFGQLVPGTPSAGPTSCSSCSHGEHDRRAGAGDQGDVHPADMDGGVEGAQQQGAEREPCQHSDP